MSEYLQVSTTTASEEEARRIASALLERRLAACVQVVGPIESRYWWEGKIEDASEWLCLIKTAASRYGEVEATIAELHSYDEPEVVATPIVAGREGYLEWVRGSTRPGSPDQ
ncbi:MAG TPA: divalent-cation tolerance protein CutA [Solirubrobacterales bacterium]|nr:divalent-cation tolerance protein CutA [Solirubrobacterales bacterium]